MQQDVDQRIARKRRRPTREPAAFSIAVTGTDNINSAESAVSPNTSYCSSMSEALIFKPRNFLFVLWLVASTVLVIKSRRQQSNTTSTTKQHSTCSCWDKGDECCDRKILRAHKMGVVLIRDLIQNPLGISSSIIHPSVLNHSQNDYRHAVITRPIYDSIISGYLYHKSGRECWLDQEGNARRQNKTFEWTSKLSHQPPHPPSRNQTLCAYLNEESESDGTRTVVDLALTSWYGGLLAHYDMVKRREATNNRHTLYVCFDELSNPITQQATIQKIVEWLYPGGYHDYAIPQKPKQHASYKGGHSTHSGAAERKRLYHMVKHHDKKLFHGMGAKMTETFGCDNRSVK